MTDLVFVSDLHLGAARRGGQWYDEAFARFADHLCSRRPPDSVVLLGDVFDFLETVVSTMSRRAQRAHPDALASAKLDQLAAEHPGVFDALSRLLDHGVGVDVMVGNHDLELVQMATQSRLRRLLGADRSSSSQGKLRFRPWFLYVPGVVYAAHGHQLHDINAVDDPLGPTRGGRTRLPLASHLPNPHRSLGHNLRKVAALTAATASAISPARSGRRKRYRQDVVIPDAGSLGVPAQVAASLYDLEIASVAGITGRLLKAARQRQPAVAGSRTGQGDYMHRGARRVHDVLARTGLDVPFYVFGHTHVAETFPLLDPLGPRYLNTGTWSPFRRGCSAEPQLTFVRVSRGLDAPEGVLLRWDEALGREEVVGP